MDLQGGFRFVGKSGGREHMEIRDAGGEICKLGAVAAFGNVPGLGFTVFVAGYKGRAVVACFYT